MQARVSLSGWDDVAVGRRRNGDGVAAEPARRAQHYVLSECAGTCHVSTGDALTATGECVTYSVAGPYVEWGALGLLVHVAVPFVLLYEQVSAGACQGLLQVAPLELRQGRPQLGCVRPLWCQWVSWGHKTGPLQWSGWLVSLEEKVGICQHALTTAYKLKSLVPIWLEGEDMDAWCLLQHQVASLPHFRQLPHA